MLLTNYNLLNMTKLTMQQTNIGLMRRNLINAHLLAQSVQQLDELKHVVVGGEIEDGLETHISLNYNVAYTYVVKAIHERNGQIKQQQQEQLDAHKQQIDRLKTII